MTIVFAGSAGRFATPYAKILMLRDNVQHHLQAGHPTPGYSLIHAVADAALDEGELTVAPSDLWNEVSLALAGIRDIKLRELAMSIRTRAVLTGAGSLPVVRGTILLRLAGWQVPFRTDGIKTLGDMFQDILAGVDRITESGNARGPIEVATESNLRLVRPARSAELGPQG